jgi:hypothetical protein
VLAADVVADALHGVPPVRGRWEDGTRRG